ncbi:MAG: DNA polymerase III subunit alpha [Spirochaetes bacterium]|nr:DNA polymerase III subunit alpha [Spirochaetota bacterium]
MDFVHLHNHSDFSVLDGAITIKKLVARAVELGMPGVAVTDHGNMFGAIELYQEAEKAGIKPVIGQEFYVAPDSRLRKESQNKGKDASYHLLLIAKNETGYKNLIKLSSIGYTEGFYYKPRIDREVLEKYKDGLICSSACIKGEIPSLCIKGRSGEARNKAGEYRELFGQDNFFLEIQYHGIPEQKTANTEIIKLSKALNIPLIVTNDCHYLYKSDSYSHEILLCIQTGKTFTNEDRMKFSSDQFYFKSAEEMKTLFPDHPEAMLNTRKILDMINLKLSLGSVILPHFDVPEGFTLDSYLKHLTYKGAEKRFPEGIPDDVKKRIEYELTVITGMNFSGYFLIVWDFIEQARKMNIPVGPGRGSAAGSIVSYCLRITDLDPMKYNLLFERFLNPDRNEMPDIDIDFCADRREEVIDYVKNKYGEDHVSQISTFNRMTAKAVLKDVARVMNVPFADANQVTKLIPNFSSLEDTLRDVDEFKKLYKDNKEWKKHIDTARTLEGLCRSVGRHAAGVVISRGPVTEHVPLYRDSSDGSISSQFEKGDLEKAGLVKMDFLGLKNLTIIDKCIKLIKKHRGIDIDISQIPMNDKKTYKLLANASTNGVFQLESSGMQKLLRELGPTEFEDIIAIVALYRPGPLNSGMTKDFIARKRNPKKIKYPHPILEPILKDTLGVIVYQEQVMQISRAMGGFSMPEADKLRKAMGKKKMDIVNKMEKPFLDGAKKNNIDIKLAQEIYSAMREFGEYGFNKSHSAAYAVISYQTAYLKANYAIEYMAALLSSQPDKKEDVIQYINDCKSMGIQVLPPDINTSEYDFTVQESSIRFGLGAIKGAGSKVIDAIIQSRNKSGRFNTLKDFLENIDTAVLNKGVLEALIKAGAFDSIFDNRAALFNSIDLITEIAKNLQIDKASGQGSLFDTEEASGSGSSVIDLPAIDDWTDKKKLNYEKEVLGLFISGHPLEKYKHEIADLPCTSISDLGEAGSGEAAIVGIITNLKVKSSKSGKLFGIANIEDTGGIIEALFFPNVYQRYSELIESDEPLMVKGKVEFEDDIALKIVAQEVKTLKDVKRDSVSGIHINFNSASPDENILKSLKAIIVKYQGANGKCPVYFHLNGSNGDHKTIKAHHAFNTMPSDKLRTELSAIVGTDSVYFTHMKTL